jgi:hypothetical protein
MKGGGGERHPSDFPGKNEDGFWNLRKSMDKTAYSKRRECKSPYISSDNETHIL